MKNYIVFANVGHGDNYRLWYKAHQIPKLKRFSSGLKVVFTQSIEARC